MKTRMNERGGLQFFNIQKRIDSDELFDIVPLSLKFEINTVQKLKQILRAMRKENVYSEFRLKF